MIKFGDVGGCLMRIIWIWLRINEQDLTSYDIIYETVIIKIVKKMC